MLKNILLFLLACGIGIGIYWFYTQSTQKTQPPITQILKENPTIPISYAVKNPPSDTLMGTMSDLTGEIKLEARDATEPAKLTNKQPVMQGERIVTAEKSSVRITFGADTTILLDKNTDVSFTQTLPISIVITQNNGTVTYSQDTDRFPLSVRVRNLLVRLQSGNVAITLEDGDPRISVSVIDGSAKTAYNNAQFESQVNTLSKGDVMIFDSDARDATVD